MTLNRIALSFYLLHVAGRKVIALSLPHTSESTQYTTNTVQDCQPFSFKTMAELSVNLVCAFFVAYYAIVQAVAFPPPTRPNQQTEGKKMPSDHKQH